MVLVYLASDLHFLAKFIYGDKRYFGRCDLYLLPVHAEPFIERIWELRRNVGVYDASYVALSEALSTTFITADRRLTRIEGLHCDVRLPG